MSENVGKPTTPRPTISPFTSIMIAIIVVFLGMVTAGKDPFTLLLINPLINALVIAGHRLPRPVRGRDHPLHGAPPLRHDPLHDPPAGVDPGDAVDPERSQEIQKKYKDPKRRQEEIMRLYKENNINPLGCFMPMVIQIGVFMALYRALVHLVGGSPESLISLSGRLYPFAFLQYADPPQPALPLDGPRPPGQRPSSCRCSSASAPTSSSGSASPPTPAPRPSSNSR